MIDDNDNGKVFATIVAVVMAIGLIIHIVWEANR